MYCWQPGPATGVAQSLLHDVHLPKFKLKPTLLHVCRSSGATCSFSRRGCPAPSACGLQCRESTRTGFQRAITCVCISLRFISPKKQLVCVFFFELGTSRSPLFSLSVASCFVSVLLCSCLCFVCAEGYFSACVFCVHLFILCSSGRLLLRR